MDEDKQVLMAQVILGDEAEKFMKSDLGRYIKGRIDQDIQELKDKLVEIDPEDINNIRKIQNEIRLRNLVLNYFKELIIEGQQALQILQEEER